MAFLHHGNDVLAEPIKARLGWISVGFPNRHVAVQFVTLGNPQVTSDC